MMNLLYTIIEFYRYVNDDLADSRTKDLYLIGSPFPIICILTGYVYFVKKWGPRLMKKYQPLNLKKTLILYNAVQVIVNSYVFVQALRLGWGGKYNWICVPMDWSVTEENIKITRLCYVYFIIKMTDLLDTVFMVLRKKSNHVSFLHVYHHAGMFLLGWGAVKYLPGGHGTFLGLVNSFVHAVMYTYYLMSTIWDEHRHKLWWKKHLTQLQMAQFLLIGLHLSLLVFQPNCGFPKFVVFLMIPQNIFMLFLFSDFYAKAYRQAKVVVHSNGQKLH